MISTSADAALMVSVATPHHKASRPSMVNIKTPAHGPRLPTMPSRQAASAASNVGR
jgi:hypothetical protein